MFGTIEGIVALLGVSRGFRATQSVDRGVDGDRYFGGVPWTTGGRKGLAKHDNCHTLRTEVGTHKSNKARHPSGIPTPNTN